MKTIFKIIFLSSFTIIITALAGDSFHITVGGKISDLKTSKPVHRTTGEDGKKGPQTFTDRGDTYTFTGQIDEDSEVIDWTQHATQASSGTTTTTTTSTSAAQIRRTVAAAAMARQEAEQARSFTQSIGVGLFSAKKPDPNADASTANDSSCEGSNTSDASSDSEDKDTETVVTPGIQSGNHTFNGSVSGVAIGAGSKQIRIIRKK